MPERPYLDHGGRRYERHRGTWLDRGMTVSRALSRQLDAKAKEDRDLWDRCEAQDFDDDPRNRGSIRLDPRDFADLFPVSGESTIEGGSGVTPQPLRGYQSSPQRRRKRDQEHLDWEFKNSGELVLAADINGGWRPTERAWYFHASAPVPLSGDRVLMCVVTVVEDTSGHWHRRSGSHNQGSIDAAEDCTSLDSAVPSFAPLDQTGGVFQYVVNGHICRFVVGLINSAGKLNTDLPWSSREGRSQFRFVAYGLYEIPVRLRGHSLSESRPFTIELRCTLQPPPRPELQPEYEQDTPFPSGGLPSLGKRK